MAQKMAQHWRVNGAKAFLGLLMSLVVAFWLAAPVGAAEDYTDVYRQRVQVLRDRLEMLQTFVDQENWTTIRTYIHGPLGEVRRDVGYITRSLDAKQRKTAKEITSRLFADLVKLDFAARDRNLIETRETYNATREDFDHLLSLVQYP
ncbi:MAG: photosystem II protein PsbQ [Oscillatoriales cyanobacterium SM2_2_1]|nr:photosystem II protein PsbQ [Oscillatoriales cyanobacterium SM2_2_1]